jgi:protein-disulfide isomerase
MFREMASRTEQKERLRAERLARETQEKAREQRRRRLVQFGSAAGFLAICVVVVLIIVSQSGGGDSAGSGSKDAAVIEQQLKGIPQHGTVLGDPKAKATIVEYGDLQCPVCQEFSVHTSPQLISSLVRPGKAKYDFRQYTIIGPDSTTAAKAALAAGEQNRYWNFIELFYRNQGPEDSGYVTDDFLTSVAKGAGVPDIAKWNRDRQDPKWDKELAKIQNETQAIGFNATPSLMVEGPKGQKPIGSGLIPVSSIESAIKSVQ